MHIKLLVAGLLKETIRLLNGFFGRVLFGKPVIFITTSGGANYRNYTKVY